MYRASIHLALARARQEDLLSEAELHRLAGLRANDGRPGVFDRLAAVFRRNRAGRRAVAAPS